MSLYTLANEIAHALAVLDDGGEIDTDLFARLEGDLAAKAQAVCQAIASLRALAAAKKAEADRLLARAKVESGRADWLKDYLLENLQRLGQERLETPLFKIRVQTSQPAVTVACEPGQLPHEYQRITTAIAVDRDALLYAHKIGKPLPEGVTVTRGRHLVIS